MNDRKTDRSNKWMDESEWMNEWMNEWKYYLNLISIQNKFPQLLKSFQAFNFADVITYKVK